MTVKNDIVLWDNGTDKFCLFSIPNKAQYKYIDNIPCITFGISYENFCFKGYETFTLFDKFYMDTIEKIRNVHHSLNGTFRICDVGADTDGYIDFEMKNRDPMNCRKSPKFSKYFDSLWKELDVDAKEK